MSEQEQRPKEKSLGVFLSAEDKIDAFVDFVTDLRHLCEREGVTWADVLRRADHHYESEKEEKA